MRRNGPTEPVRLTGPTGTELAGWPPHAAGARCCAPGAAPPAPDGRPASPGRPEPAPSGQLAGHGTAGPVAACGHARAVGRRMAGRGLLTGGLVPCGWLVTAGGHAYASQVTASLAPHQVLPGPVPGGLPLAALVPGGLPLAAPVPGSRHPAPTLLAMPGFPGRAGVGAGHHAATMAGPVALSPSPCPGPASFLAALPPWPGHGATTRASHVGREARRRGRPRRRRPARRLRADDPAVCPD